MTILHFHPAAAPLPNHAALAPASDPRHTSPAPLLPGAGGFLQRIMRAVGLWLIDGSTYEEVEGVWCIDCRDVHWWRDGCPRAMDGICVDCNRERPLDRFGNCTKCGSAYVVRRHLRNVSTLRLANPTRAEVLKARATTDESRS